MQDVHAAFPLGHASGWLLCSLHLLCRYALLSFVAWLHADGVFPALFLLPVRPENSDPAVRVKIALTLLQASCLTSNLTPQIALRVLLAQVLGLIKDYAVRWRPQFLLTSMSYFDVLNIGVEMTAPSCGSKTVRQAHASYERVS